MDTTRVLWNGGDVDYALFLPADPASGQQLSMAVTGWVWWQLLTCHYTLDNSAGAVNGVTALSCEGASGLRAIAATGNAIALGNTGVFFYGIGSQETAPTAALLIAPLFEAVVQGDGLVRIVLLTGDANTKIQSVRLSIIGQRYHNKK